MAIPLDKWLLDQDKERAAKKDVPLMLDRSYFPDEGQGEVTFKPEDPSKGIPIKGAAINPQGKVTAPIKGIGVGGNTPIPQTKVDELKAIFKPAEPEIPQAPVPAQVPAAPMPEKKEAPKEEKGFDWKSLLPALAPLAVEAIMGTQTGGTAGEGAGIASKYILDEEAKKEARKKEFENKLIEMQQARDIASLRYAGKQKPLTSANVLPYMAEDGKVRYKLVGEALGEEKPMDQPKGMTYEQRLNLQRIGHQNAMSKEATKQDIAAGRQFKQALMQDKTYLGYKAQLENSQKAIEWLAEGKNIADIGVKKVFAKGLFGDVGNIAVQEAQDVSGSPDLYSRYLTLKAKFNTPGVQFNDQDRADMMEFAQAIRDTVPKKMQALANQYVESERNISGRDVSKIAQALTTDPKTGDTMVTIEVMEEDPKTKAKVRNIYKIPSREYPAAVREHKAKLYLGRK